MAFKGLANPAVKQTASSKLEVPYASLRPPLTSTLGSSVTQPLDSVDAVIQACRNAMQLAPLEFPPDLPCKEELLGNNEWYRFELDAWEIGEKIRQSFLRSPKIKKNNEVLKNIVAVISHRNLRRGRQPFVLLLGFVGAQCYSREVASFVSDKDVDGQVVDTLLKMKTSEYVAEVKPLLTAKHAWVRKLAKRYVERSNPELQPREVTQ